MTPLNASFTALTVTLFLLLAVTSTVIARSLVLRRRHRRILEQGTNPRFAADVGPSTPTNGTGTRRRQRAVGEKPALWQLWTQSLGDVGKDCGRAVWTDIKPVSIAYVNKEEDKEPLHPWLEKPPPLRTQRILTFHKRPRVPQEPASSPSGVETPSSLPSQTSQLRISVLVAMPAPKYSVSSQKDTSLEVLDQLPPIEIGVVEVDTHR
ncbi:hypothetical protein EDC04DRAFT_2896686 [Pisolithus marmoratus]|nr:hypothetical protein EDC04DRAFT_2896686 [Pisolithus marmoratus]